MITYVTQSWLCILKEYANLIMPITKYRFCFKSMFTDEIAQAYATFFSPIANFITNHDCSEMVVKLGHTDPHVLPEPILNLVGIKNTFQLHYSQKTSKGKNRFRDWPDHGNIYQKWRHQRNQHKSRNTAKCLLEHNQTIKTTLTTHKHQETMTRQ